MERDRFCCADLDPFFSLPCTVQYDLSAAQFSPDGRVFQIEYAMKAVENSRYKIVKISKMNSVCGKGSSVGIACCIVVYMRLLYSTLYVGLVHNTTKTRDVRLTQHSNARIDLISIRASLMQCFVYQIEPAISL